MWKEYCRTEEVTYNNVANVHCMPDAKVYKPTLGIYLSYCFSTASMFARKCPNAML